MIRSKKVEHILLGKTDTLEGGTPLRKSLSYPLLNGLIKTIYWEGNKGLIITMYEKIEELEKKIIELEMKNYVSAYDKKLSKR
jgi:hypothetical protein